MPSHNKARDIPTPRRSRRKSVKKVFGQTSADGKSPAAVRVVAAPQSVSQVTTTTEIAELRHQISVLERHAQEHRRKSLLHGEKPNELLKQLKEETEKAAKVPTLVHQLEQANAKLEEANKEIQKLMQKIDLSQNVVKNKSNGNSDNTTTSSSNSSLDQKEQEPVALSKTGSTITSNKPIEEAKTQQTESKETVDKTSALLANEAQWQLKLQSLQQRLDTAENQLRLSRMISNRSGDDVGDARKNKDSSTRENIGKHIAAVASNNNSGGNIINDTHTASPVRASRDDWRRFAEEKREMTKRYNLDRAALAAENHRMRVALSNRPHQTEDSEKEKALVRLRSELASERMLKKAAEQQIAALSTQLQRIEGNSTIHSSAYSVGESTLATQLRQSQNEVKELKHSLAMNISNEWKNERSELMTNWNVSWQ